MRTGTAGELLVARQRLRDLSIQGRQLGATRWMEDAETTPN